MTFKNASSHWQPIKMAAYAFIFSVVSLTISTWTGVLAAHFIRVVLIDYSRHFGVKAPAIIIATAYLLACFVLLSIAITYLAIFVDLTLKWKPVSHHSENRKTVRQLTD
ncbi:MAG: hypothetical protein ABSB12_02765 [Candidatus Saccharimonadales bacterium]|jgi:type IV secretory pathway TrbL component